MKRVSRFGGILLAAALAPSSGCIVISAGDWWGCCPTVWTERVTEKVALDTAGLNAILAETHNGSIVFEAEPDPQEAYVIITKRAGGRTEQQAAEALAALQVFVEPDGAGTQRIGWRWRGEKRSGWRQNVSFEIHGPANVGFAAETHNGPVKARGITGEVDIVTHNGGVNVASSGGRLYAETHNGHIVAEYTGDDVTLVTHNGSVRADVRRCGPLNGSVTTHNGGVDVIVGESTSARIIAQTHNGSIRSAVPVNEAEVSRRKLTGTIGGGEGRLAVTTHNGSVRLKKG